MFGTLGYEPTCKPRVLAQQAGDPNPPEPCGACPQERFHAASEFDVLYGGAAGGGKTKALLMEGIRACVRHPRLRVGAFRRTYDELAESFFKELILIDYASELGAKWHGTDRELTFPNGSLIRFRYLESVQDATRRQGGEYQLVLFDELTMLPPEAVDIVRIERLRAGPGVKVLGIRSASNPGSIGHGDAKARYIDATNYAEHTYTDDFGRSVRCIPAKVKDNPHLDPGYVARLEAIPDPARRAAMLDGSWDTFAGQVFAEWSHDRHVVPTFSVPDSWSRYAGIDWGYAAPHAVIWAAFNDGRAWVYRERYGTQTPERDLARLVLEDEGAFADSGLLARKPPERVRVRAADPSMWNKVAEAAPIAETFILAGCAVIKATNDRLAGVQRVHSFLADGPACAIHRKLGWDTCPLLHVMECAPNLIRTLPALPYDEKRPEDVDTDAEDHCLTADTLVETADGPTPIGDLVGRSGWVWTPTGWEWFFDVRLTRKHAALVRVATSAGSFRCTARHRVMLANGGWREAGSLQRGDAIAWTPPSSRPRSKSGTVVASTCVAATSSGRGCVSIARSGRKPTGRCRKATTSTTATMTAPTTRWRTWPPFRPRPTSHTIRPTRHRLNERRGPKTPGAARPQATVASQPSNVPPLLDVDGSASVLSVSPAGSGDVFDLAVDHPAHAFAIEGGLVVHNCYDALRYVLMQLPVPRVGREPKPEATSHHERIAAQLAERSRRRRSSSYIGA